MNRARTEAELGDLVTAELCEAFEAEIAFVLVRAENDEPHLVGAYGITPAELSRFGEDAFLDLVGRTPLRDEGDDLLSLRRELSCAFLRRARLRGVVGVARLYDQSFDESETSLLEAVSASISHALDRHRLGEERDRLYLEATEQSKAARVIGSIADGVSSSTTPGSSSCGIPRRRRSRGCRYRPSWAARSRGAAGGSPSASSGATRRASSTGRATTVPVDVGGSEVWLSIRGVGFAEGTVYAFTDLTEDRRLEQLKADFIATVSTRLRTPPRPSTAAAKTLQREDRPPEPRSSSICLLSSPSSRTDWPGWSTTSCSQAGSTPRAGAGDRARRRRAARRRRGRGRSGARGRTLRLELVASTSPPPVLADRDRLRQVLTNLVANAVKYSPAGGRIQVDLQVRDGHLDIAVRDQGLGIAIAEQRLIFEKFYRVDANMSRGVSGSGLGLYICRELVHRMGGTIAVESQPGGLDVHRDAAAGGVTFPTAAVRR